MNNPERIDRIRRALRANHWDLVACALPMNVLLLSGYWPVVGAGVAIASSDGRISLLVPEDEENLAKRGWADEIRTFDPGSLHEFITTAEAIRVPLQKLASSLCAKPSRVAYEAQETSEPASYSAIHFYGETMRSLLGQAFPNSALTFADEGLAELRTRKTSIEIDQIRIACHIAETAFQRGLSQTKVGMTEVEIAGVFRQPLSNCLVDFPKADRADGFAWCMSGPNSALASGAYAQSRVRAVRKGDPVLIHMNSYANGYWTDITRTYCVGKLDRRLEKMYDAVFAARRAAFSAIRPGAKAADVDAAARDTLKARGFGPQFKHSTGHGVGFSAINPNARPRLHPKSEETLEVDMVCNVEPAVYFDGYGGIRHCDMVKVTNSGMELLTQFQSDISELVLDEPKQEWPVAV